MDEASPISEWPRFADKLVECDDRSSITLANGGRFIRKLPDDRPLGYLHKFYAPLSDIALLGSMVSRLPDSYIAFLQWANGASLFDNTLSLYGYVRNIARSSAPEFAAPISLNHGNEIFAAVKHQRWMRGWTEIGAVMGWSSVYKIELNSDGRCAVTSENEECSSASLEQCMRKVIDRLAACFDCRGLLDESGTELEAALSSLVMPQ